MATEMVTAISTALGQIKDDAISVITVIIPVAIGIAGLVFVLRKAMGWFKAMAGK